NLGLHLDIVEPEKTIHHVLDNKIRINNAIHNKFGVDIIPGSYIYNSKINYLKLENKLNHIKKRYDFVILDSNKQMLLYYKNVIDCFLKNHLLLELHPAKSKIIPLSQGISFLGYKIFYKYKRLRKTNRKAFARKFQSKIDSFQEGAVSYDQLLNFVLSWFSYAKWANTYRLRKKIIQKINKAKAESENADSTKSL
ncbi:hypothetical protein HYT51_02225, partial [Candidatus Woesearchaeota archaeon]|nr:hypothetical protein [Candidatus Woesearchaeota archaeon]